MHKWAKIGSKNPFTGITPHHTTLLTWDVGEGNHQH